MDRGAKLAVAFAAVVLAVVVYVAMRPTAERLSPKAQQAEAYANLALILEQEQRMRRELGEFLSVGPTGPLPDADAMAWPSESCPSDCRGANLESCTSFSCLDFAPSAKVRYRYACRGEREALSCAAIGDLDHDGEPSLLVVGTSSTGQLSAPLPALGVAPPKTRCDAIERVPSEVVYDCTPGEL